MRKLFKKTPNDTNVDGEELSISEALQKAEKLMKRGKKLVIAGSAIAAVGIIALVLQNQDETTKK